MSSLPPVSEVIDASLKVVLPAFFATAITAVCGSKLFGKRSEYLTVALAIVLGLVAANAFRGVFVTRFDVEKPLTAVEWGRGLLTVITGQVTAAEPVESEESVTEAESVATESPSAKIPKSGRYWIPSAVALAVLAEVLAKSLKCPMALLQLVRLLASIGAARLFVPAELALGHPWLLWLVGAVVFLGWVIAEQLSIRTPAGLVSACVVLASFAAATVLIHAHSARLTDAATMLLAASGGLAVVAWWRGVDAAGAASVGAVFLPAIMIAVYHETFSEVPLPAFILPVVVPLCAGLVLVLPEAWRRNWRVWIAAAICASVPAITSIILTVRAESLSF